MPCRCSTSLVSWVSLKYSSPSGSAARLSGSGLRYPQTSSLSLIDCARRARLRSARAAFALVDSASSNALFVEARLLSPLRACMTICSCSSCVSLSPGFASAGTAGSMLASAAPSHLSSKVSYTLVISSSCASRCSGGRCVRSRPLQCVTSRRILWSRSALRTPTSHFSSSILTTSRHAVMIPRCNASAPSILLNSLRVVGHSSAIWYIRLEGRNCSLTTPWIGATCDR